MADEPYGNAPKTSRFSPRDVTSTLYQRDVLDVTSATAAGVWQSQFARRARRAIRCPALMLCPGSYQQIEIVDFAEDGLGLDNTLGLSVGDTIVLEVLAGMCLEGKVCWSNGSRANVSLATTLGPYNPILSHLNRLADM